MSRAALKRVETWLAQTDSQAVAVGMPPLAFADLRAVLALAREAVRIKSETAAFLKWARDGHGRAALAPLPARTPRKGKR